MSSTTDRVVASLGDCILRESDLQILRGPHWLNDRIIGFYFEYLHQNKFESSRRICFVSPEVSQFLKMVQSPVEASSFLEPLELDEKDLILMAVNNAQDPDQPGGSHWSLLIYSRQAREFFHLDSSGGMNDDDARTLSNRLHRCLTSSTSAFPLTFTPVSVLGQTNGHDCGIHVLSHAENDSRHFLVYGSCQGLQQVEAAALKNKREEILRTVMEFGKSASSADSAGGEVGGR